MGIDIDIATPEGWHAALAALAWQVDSGVAEVIGESPVNAYDLPERAPWLPAAAAKPAAAPGKPQPSPPRGPAEPYVPSLSAAERERLAADTAVAEATAAAAAAQSLPALRDALAGFDHCEIKRGARNLVFADGRPGARVLVLGEAPGREEDVQGKPFVGPEGAMLDRMFAAIGLARDSDDPRHALYLMPVLPWRPPGNRDPSPEEIAMMRPFVERHIALAAPDLVVLMGNAPCACLLGAKGILRLRGQWTEAVGRPALPMTHPGHLLRTPAAKREAWADLLDIRARLDRT